AVVGVVVLFLIVVATGVGAAAPANVRFAARRGARRASEPRATAGARGYDPARDAARAPRRVALLAHIEHAVATGRFFAHGAAGVRRRVAVHRAGIALFGPLDDS